MYIVKVKTVVTPEARALAPARIMPLLEAGAKWQACVIRYGSLEAAEAMIKRRLSVPDRFGCLRQWRIFKLEGRKQVLVKEIGE